MQLGKGVVRHGVGSLFWPRVRHYRDMLFNVSTVGIGKSLRPIWKTYREGDWWSNGLGSPRRSFGLIVTHEGLVVKYLGWVDLYRHGMFHHPAWEVDSRSSGLPAKGTPQTQANPTKVFDHQSHSVVIWCEYATDYVIIKKCLYGRNAHTLTEMSSSPRSPPDLRGHRNRRWSF